MRAQVPSHACPTWSDTASLASRWTESALDLVEQADGQDHQRERRDERATALENGDRHLVSAKPGQNACARAHDQCQDKADRQPEEDQLRHSPSSVVCHLIERQQVQRFVADVNLYGQVELATGATVALTLNHARHDESS